jgi:hypothetical protein
LAVRRRTIGRCPKGQQASVTRPPAPPPLLCVARAGVEAIMVTSSACVPRRPRDLSP